MPLNAFLSLILPEDGYKCWVEINQAKKVIQGFVLTVEELATKLLEIDARGHDAYYACATFTTPNNRRAGNAKCAKAFWLDVDAGEGKPYATADEAIDALDDFCARTQLPLPGVVRSGNGIHAYWPLDRVLTGTEWSGFAQRFKLLTQAAGFACDPSRTADVASILRPPGTKNYKLPDQPRPVEVDDLECFAPISCDEVTACFIKIPSVTQTPVINNPSVNASMTAGISRAFDVSKGVAAGSRGSTQLRYAGELVAKGHTQEEVLYKCLEWNNLCTPPQDEKEVARIVKSAFTMHANKHPAAAAVTAPMSTDSSTPLSAPVTALPPLPYGYKWGNANELMVAVGITKDDGATEYTWKVITHLPVFLASWMNEEGYRTKNSYLFNHYHPAKGWCQFAMGAREFNGGEWYGLYAENGCSIIDGMDKVFKTYVRRAENMMRATGGEVTRYTQLGWKADDNSFLVGDNLCHADGRVEKAIGTDKLTPLMNAMKPARGGSLEAWSAAANKLGTPSMEAHLFMLLCSFAAPLMKFCVDEGNGGSILSVISEESGQGKTPIATAIASVWGDLASTVVTGNFTENRRIEDLVRHCHLIQVQEEMAYSDPTIAAQSIEKFTSGTDRGRLTQAGAATGMPERYQTILLSLSNKSLYELVRMVNVPMSRRVFEIEIARPEDEAIANLGGVARDMMRNCGYAGLQYIRLLVNPQINKYVKDQLMGTGTVGPVQLKYRTLLKSKPEDRFIIWLLSTAEVAATILTHYGIMAFDVSRIMQWAIEQAHIRIHTPNAADASALKLNSFINEHIDYCLTVPGPYAPKMGPLLPLRVPHRKIGMRLEMRNERLYVEHDLLQKWCTRHNISFITMGKHLVESGVVLERSKPVTLGAGTEIASGRSLCWEIDMGHPAISGQLRIELREDKPAAATA